LITTRQLVQQYAESDACDKKENDGDSDGDVDDVHTSNLSPKWFLPKSWQGLWTLHATKKDRDGEIDDVGLLEAEGDKYSKMIST
jgi:hypothetical protein